MKSLKKIQYLSDAVLRGQLQAQSRKIASHEVIENPSQAQKDEHAKCAAYSECLKKELELRGIK